MIRRSVPWVALVAVLILAAGSSGHADRDDRPGRSLSGIINDYTLAMFGSWEVRGTWSMDLKDFNSQGEFKRADFSAALTMERSDYWMVTTPGDPNSLTARNAHTHHIALVNGTAAPITGGFSVSGPVSITANGGVPPFGTSSTLEVDITGGTLVANSNIKLTFGGNAATHFGSDPVSGVVRKWK